MSNDHHERLSVRDPRGAVEPAAQTFAIDPPGIDPRVIGEFLHRRWRMIAATCCIGLILSTVAAYSAPPTYTANAQLLVEARALRPAGKVLNDDPAIETEIAMLTSDAHLRHVMETLIVKRHDYFEVQDGALLAGARVWLVDQVHRTLSYLGLREKEDDSHSMSLAAFKRGLSVAQERKSRIITIKYTHVDPERAALAANEIAELHVATREEMKRSNAQELLEWVDRELDAAQASVKDAKRAYQRLRLSSGLDEKAPKETFLIADTARQLGDAQDALARLRASKQAPPAEFSAAGPISASSTSEARSAHELHVAELRVLTLQEKLRSEQNSASMTADRITGAQALEAEAAQSTRLVDDLLRRKQALVEDRDLAQSDAQLVSRAWAPTAPSSISPVLIMPAAFVFFALLGASAGFIADRWDRTLRNDVELENALRQPCTAVLPQLPNRPDCSAWHVLFDEPSSAFAQAMRHMLLAVLSDSQKDEARDVILFTSSGPGEGKTSLAMSFAACLVCLDRRVLLVDFEGRGPSPTAGSEIGLEIITGRDLGIDATTLVGFQRGSEALRSLLERFDHIIIDGPAMSSGTSARMLARISHEVIFAVQWGKTSRDDASMSVRCIDRMLACAGTSAQKLHVVLTRVPKREYEAFRFMYTGDVFAESIQHRNAWKHSSDTPETYA